MQKAQVQMIQEAYASKYFSYRFKSTIFLIVKSINPIPILNAPTVSTICNNQINSIG